MRGTVMNTAQGVVARLNNMTKLLLCHTVLTARDCERHTSGAQTLNNSPLVRLTLECKTSTDDVTAIGSPPTCVFMPCAFWFGRCALPFRFTSRSRVRS